MYIKNDLLDIHKVEYRNAIDLMFGHCSDFCLVGLFGSIKNYGISDIDMAIIGNKNQLIKSIKVYQNLRRHDFFNYCFYHEPLFILNDISDILHNVHTVENVTWINNKSNYKKKESNPILYIVWFIFLINLIARLKYQSLQGTISKRRILLLHKNIYRSYCFFKDEEMDEEYIKKVRSFNNYDLYKELIRTITRAFRHFDQYCKMFNEKKVIDEITIKNYTYIKSDYTNIEVDDYKVNIFLNNYSMYIFENYYNVFFLNKCKEILDTELYRYFNSVFLCKQAYKKAKLNYPFIEPIPYFLTRKEQ